MPPEAFTVTVQVPNDGSIKLGMSANLFITVAEATDVLTVPVSAVSGAGDAKFVSVYKDGALAQVPVTTGISDGTTVEVSGDMLHEGDAVVLNEAGGEAGGAAADAGAASSVSIVMS